MYLHRLVTAPRAFPFVAIDSRAKLANARAVRVRFRQRVIVFAVGLSGVLALYRIATQHGFLRRNSFQVFGPDAGRVFANRASHKFRRRFVRCERQRQPATAPLHPGHSEETVPILVFVAIPNPAAPKFGTRSRERAELINLLPEICFSVRAHLLRSQLRFSHSKLALKYRFLSD
jgi:hypothetical protein